MEYCVDIFYIQDPTWIYTKKGEPIRKYVGSLWFNEPSEEIWEEVFCITNGHPNEGAPKPIEHLSTPWPWTERSMMPGDVVTIRLGGRLHSKLCDWSGWEDTEVHDVWTEQREGQ